MCYLFILQDAAGHVDPLTGEGIHTAMLGAKIAAECVGEMIKKGQYSLDACKAYELRCYDKFGYEFWSSSICAKVIYHFPISIDAVAVVGKRRGQKFLDFFGEVSLISKFSYMFNSLFFFMRFFLWNFLGSFVVKSTNEPFQLYKNYVCFERKRGKKEKMKMQVKNFVFNI